jgi:UDP-N-acetylmuramate dehydrogenase
VSVTGPRFEFDYAELAADCGVPARAEVPLAGYTTLRVGGPAAWLFEPSTVSEAGRLFAALHEGPLPVRVLGAGSNLIVADAGVRAAVIHTGRLHAEPRRELGQRVRVPAGVPIPGLARWAQRAGLAGLEFAEGIPGQLGGAVRMNAGASGQWIGSLLRRVTVAGPSGLVQERMPTEQDFGYRDSFVARERLIVLDAVLELSPDDPEAIKQRLLASRERRRATQPVQERSAGCAFTNWPDLPAGRLIDQLGLKGHSIGGAEVSRLHGNFLINRGDATASDVLALLEHVAETIVRETGRTPRVEIEIWSDPR